MAGQRLMAGFDGTTLSDDLKYYIDTLKVGGIILFAGNIDSPDQLGALCRATQAYARSCGQPPLFIAIDQEGGQVARLKPPFTVFPGNPAIHDKAAAKRFAEITATELRGIGVNMNMAPVLDVAPREIDSIMAGRAFGHDPDRVAHLGVTVINGLQQHCILSIAKHFPGIGRTVLDSHLDLPTLAVSLADLAAFDLIPFQAAIDRRVAGVMLSHIHYPQLDKRWPASLSPAIADNLLRSRMGFDGLVLTDDLDMGAIKKHYDIKTAMDQILAADIDIALICHQGPDIPTAFDVIVDRMQRSESMAQRAKTAVQRILKAKKDIKIRI